VIDGDKGDDDGDSDGDDVGDGDGDEAPRPCVQQKGTGKTNLGGFEPSRKSKNLPKTERNPVNRKYSRPLSNAD